jgi:hypothetical protein
MAPHSRASQHPVRRRTTPTVRTSNLRSRRKEHSSWYSVSNHALSAKVTSLRLLTCHRPVIPGRMS